MSADADMVPVVRPFQERWEPMEKLKPITEVSLPSFSKEIPEFPPLLPVVRRWSLVERPEVNSSLEWLRLVGSA